MAYRNAKKEVRKVKASSLIRNPLNWRQHPDDQQDIMRSLLDEIGDIDYLKVVEVPEGLLMLDGHLRADIYGEEDVEVLVLDLDENQRRKLLASFDAVTLMAQQDQGIYSKLIHSIEFEDPLAGNMLEAMDAGNYMSLALIPLGSGNEWEGMPEFQHDDQSSWKHITVHFANIGDLETFARLTGLIANERTRFLWFPKIKVESYLKDQEPIHGP